MIALVVVYFSLVLTRVAAFVAVLPLLGGQHLPRTVKAGLAVALTVMWGATFWERMPVSDWLRASSEAQWLGLGIAIGREAVLGAVVGYAFGLFLVPAHIAGEYISQEMGLTFGNQVNATGTGSGTPLTIVFELVASAIFLGCDGHHVFLGVMHNTFINYPVGGGLPTMPVQELVAGVTATEEWGLMLAAPVAVCLFLTTVVMMLLGRTTPQLNLYSIGFSLRLGVGLVAILLLLPHSVDTMVSIFGHVSELMGRMF